MERKEDDVPHYQYKHLIVGGGMAAAAAIRGIAEVDPAASIGLDGEIADPANAASLPSGNGQPLGDAVWTFTVEASACYANCDGSTTPPALNVIDFACFLNRFAAGEAYANCDGSTTPPVLNVLDFACFLNAFAAGCP